VLSMLSMGPSHGYGLRELMEAWHMDAWADIRYGSIYQALRTMAKDGLVAEVSSKPPGRRPPRTTYQITEAGREELRRLSRRAWSEPSRHVEPINVALSFRALGILDDGEIVELLDLRLARLRQAAGELRAEEEKVLAQSDDPGFRAGMVDHMGHFGRLVETEREWTAHVRDQVRSGAYTAGQKTKTSRRR